MEDLRRRFTELLAELDRMQITTELRGCTAEEISKLEGMFEVSLPLAYRLYLESMGHSAGRLFTHDDLEVTYGLVLGLRAQLEDFMSGSAVPDAPEFRLPPGALVIAGRYNEQFHYILCDEREDSPVFHVDIWYRGPRRVYPDVLAWLRGHAAEAEEAIRCGFFDKYPEGTKQ